MILVILYRLIEKRFGIIAVKVFFCPSGIVLRLLQKRRNEKFRIKNAQMVVGGDFQWVNADSVQTDRSLIRPLHNTKIAITLFTVLELLLYLQ